MKMHLAVLHSLIRILPNVMFPRRKLSGMEIVLGRTNTLVVERNMPNIILHAPETI
jgi:hypothetical protein